MWKTTLAALLTLVLASAGLHAKSRHDDNIDAAIGGLITGVILSEIFDSDDSVNIHLASRRGDRGSRYGDRGRDGRRDGYQRDNRHRRDGWSRYHNDYRDYDRHDYRRDRGHRDGYYAYKSKKVWVPGHWDYVRNRYGRTIKVWVEGRREWRKLRVWVPSKNRGGRYCY